eukprot:scaffold20137_cov36-Phaeocystis_antarctica.AAC.1
MRQHSCHRAAAWSAAGAGRRQWTRRAGRLPVAPPSAIIEFTSLSSCSWSLNRAVLKTGANMVSRTKERAIDPLLVPALLQRYSPSSASLPSLSESAPGGQKSQNWRLAPGLKAAPSRWALRGSAARAKCAAQPGPWRARPRRPR